MLFKKNLVFLLSYFRDMNIGAVIPSTRFVVSRVIRAIEFSRVSTVLEFGPGEGVMTRAVLAQLRKEGSIITFEPNADMREQLLSATNDARLAVFDDVAENATERFPVKKFDLVLASNPFSKVADRKGFLKGISAMLAEGGNFIIFNQHIPVGLKKDLQTCFGGVKMVWEPRNLPPWSFIYFCSRPIHE
jgi:phospholipid N-methyltransferase